METISGTERIRNEFRTVERTVAKTINSNYQIVLDVTVLRNDYKQDWMNLAQRFVSDPSGITLKDADGTTIGRTDFTEEEKENNSAVEDNIRYNGYHPGMPVFPVMTPDIQSYLEAQGVAVDANETGSVFILTYPDTRKETYNIENLTIVKEWMDDDAVRTVETNGYEPYLINKGYLQRIRKTERFVNSINGACITEVKLVYFAEYDIRDYDGLIDKTTEQTESVTVFPNPNNGLFNASVQLGTSNAITGCFVVNMMTGTRMPVNPALAHDFSVDMVSADPGNYVLQVFTDKSTLSFHFFKQ